MKRACRLAILAAGAALVGLAMWSDFPLCPLASSLGIPCPGCGLTRATLALAHGDVRAALHFHPLVWLLSPLFIGFVGAAVWDLARDSSVPRPPAIFRWDSRVVSAVAVAILIVSLGVWVARFAGYFGGPVPVTTLHAWLAARR